jgi:anti-sigma factor RsiW
VAQVRMAMNDYAGALESYRQYLRDADGRIPAERRAAVEREIAELEQRVATLTIKSDVSGADVLVDEVLVGTTPLAAPVLVNAGVRRVVVRHPEHPVQSQRLSLAGGDRQDVMIALAARHAEPAADASKRAEAPRAETPAASPADLTVRRREDTERKAPPEPARGLSPRALRVSGFAVTGVLAAGALTTGLLALKHSRDLASMRENQRVSRSQLKDEQAKVTRLAISSDVLAGVALASLGVSLWLTLRPERDTARSRADTRGAPPRTVRLGVGPGGLTVDGRF